MAKNGLKIIIAYAFAAMMAACGTSEANYKKAYDKAKEKEGSGIESTIYNRVRQQSREERIVAGRGGICHGIEGGRLHAVTFEEV